MAGHSSSFRRTGARARRRSVGCRTRVRNVIMMAPPADSSGERELARLAADGGQRALSVLYERHFHEVFGYQLAVLGDRPEAEEAAEQTFVRAGEELFSREDWRTFRHRLLVLAHDVASQHVTDPERHVVFLCHVLDLHTAEVADIVECSPATVRRLEVRGIRSLRPVLARMSACCY